MLRFSLLVSGTWTDSGFLRRVLLHFTFLGHGISPKLQVSANLHCRPLCASSLSARTTKAKRKRTSSTAVPASIVTSLALERFPSLGVCPRAGRSWHPCCKGSWYCVRSLVCNACLGRAGGIGTGALISRQSGSPYISRSLLAGSALWVAMPATPREEEPV